MNCRMLDLWLHLSHVLCIEKVHRREAEGREGAISSMSMQHYTTRTNHSPEFYSDNELYREIYPGKETTSPKTVVSLIMNIGTVSAFCLGRDNDLEVGVWVGVQYTVSTSARSFDLMSIS